MYLKKIVDYKKKRLLLEKAYLPISSMAFEQGNHRFEKVLAKEGLSLIGEIKKASPSKGNINLDVDVMKYGEIYNKEAVDAISILTEDGFFKGHLDYLMKLKGMDTPILRKDFIIDEYQIHQTAHTGADAALLICAILEEKDLKKYIELLNGYGLDALVEVHDQEEVEMALSAGAKIIGINNRNLKTFEVDFEHAIKLRDQLPKGILTVAESGIRDNNDVKRIRSAGFDSILVGETLMRSKDVAGTIRELMR